MSYIGYHRELFSWSPRNMCVTTHTMQKHEISVELAFVSTFYDKKNTAVSLILLTWVRLVFWHPFPHDLICAWLGEWHLTSPIWLKRTFRVALGTGSYTLEEKYRNTLTLDLLILFQRHKNMFILLNTDIVQEIKILPSKNQRPLYPEDAVLRVEGSPW